MPLDRAWLLSHLPHQGSMCLLDHVDEWDTERLRCSASSHRNIDNPLRANDRLGAVCGIEYAAQAMAAHGALMLPAGDKPRVGYLTSVRAVELRVHRLDDIAADLSVEVERLSGNSNDILYRFSIMADGIPLLTGRAAVVLDAEAIGRPA